MPEYADLEIGIYRYDTDSYSVELRYTNASVENRSDRGTARFDFAVLRRLSPDPDAYGQQLSQYLFVDSQVLEMFSQSCALTLVEPEDKLRVRLFIDRSAPELHSLRWETLTDPRPAFSGSRLLNNERILFSRYLRSADWRAAGTAPKSDLRALIVIANPRPHPEKPQLPDVNVDEELARARTGLEQFAPRELISNVTGPAQVTLENLLAQLREGCDILYLLCHGSLLEDTHGTLVPYIWLEDKDGTAMPVSGLAFVEGLRNLATQPRMIVLGSCQSAGQAEAIVVNRETALASLGPRLVEAGIPAVLAMQGNVAIETVAGFMPAFFQQLSEHGQIEQAMAVARGVVRQHSHWWMPVLFSRLRGGRFWYQPGFRTPEGRPEFDWARFLRRLHDRKCTPILGYGLLESVLGSTREIAKSWADQYGFPMERHYREDLPQVAQYLKSVNENPRFPYEELEHYLLERLRKRYGSQFSVDTRQPQTQQFETLLAKVIAHRAQNDPAEPHRVLARLPFEVYITTNPDNILTSSLKTAPSSKAEVPKQPSVLLCPWNTDIERMEEAEPAVDVDRPLVFHLFGQLHEPASLVLSEDDYFDYLIGVTSNRDLIPSVVRKKQRASQLLFLGFQTDAWNLRILLRGIQWQRSVDSDDRSARHIAVQVNPDEDRLENPTRAREYLEKYFGAPKNKIGIYWGNAEDFIKELRERWNEMYPAEGI